LVERELMGDTPDPPSIVAGTTQGTSGAGFFDRDSTLEFIQRLSAEKRLTIFAGAGVSIDRGSPHWWQLVFDLMVERVDELMDGEVEADDIVAAEEAVAAFLSDNGVIQGASVVRQMFTDVYSMAPEAHLHNGLYDLLYDDWVARDSLASAIATCALTFKVDNRNVHIITTNYDTNIEQAIHGDPALSGYAEQDGYRFVTLGKPPGRTLKPGDIPVVHIHGCIEQDGGVKGDIVFCEADYGKWSMPERPSDHRLSEYIEGRFRNSAVLFVGSSMNDPNIINLMLRTQNRARRPRSVISPVAADRAKYGPTMQGQVFDHLSHVGTLRLSHVGVDEVIQPDFYGQVSQLLHEVALGVDQTANEYRPYRDRIRLWWSQWDQKRLERDRKAARSAKGYLDTRHMHQHRLSECLDGLLVAGVLPNPDCAKIELWIRCDPDSRNLVLWSSSEVVQVSSRSEHCALISPNSPYKAVQAFASRKFEEGTIDISASQRWGQYLACPVILMDKPWYNLPVGVVTLMIRRGFSITSRDRDLAEISDTLCQTARKLLNPGGK
jgi:hypothetical protein